MGTSKTMGKKSLIENYLEEMKEQKLTTIISLTEKI